LFKQISTGALAHDVRRLPTVAPSFDPRFCSPSESLDKVERRALHRAQAGSGLRLLFGGPPGGGKTQYALWLAKRLGRDVILKRPSDLLSKYVGESEQQIAAVFRAAAEMMEIDDLHGTPDHADGADGTGAVPVVEEILANARGRDRTRGIGF